MSDKISYCVCSIEKITSETGRGSFQTRFDHNTRRYTPANVDIELTHLNRELVAMKENATYISEFKDTINEAIYNGTMNKVRSNAVKGIEIVMNYSNSDALDINVDSWANDSMEWAKERFGGEKNIKHAVLHMDESCGPHIHVVVVPMNDKGRLSCKSFIDGPGDCSRLQTEYAQKVGSKYGMNRGVKYSSIDNKTLWQYKRDTIGRAKVTREEIMPLESELDGDGHILPVYIERVQDIVQAAKFQVLDEKNKLQQEYNIQQSELIQQEVEFRRLRKEYEDKLKKLDKILFNIKNKILSEKMSIDELEKTFKTYDAVTRGLKDYPDKEYAQKIAEGLNKISKWQHRKDKETERQLDKDLGL